MKLEMVSTPTLRDPDATTLKAERKRLIWVNDQYAIAG
jgi:hypothetical protein